MLGTGFRLKVGFGEVSFFFDDWLDSELLCNKVPWVAIQDTVLRVKYVWSQEAWLFNTVYTILPPDVQNEITGSEVMVNEGIPDCYSWKGMIDGVYSVKAGYYWLLDSQASVASHQSWSWVWKLKFLDTTAILPEVAYKDKSEEDSRCRERPSPVPGIF
ncbi:hypothetical protein RIF29_29870 [Crotalaria pallida]|uniref:Uncharacterized protein n=1 Tax=Crotalaria pallida TaxID=3830 RepID=A0AAN9EFB2_CROPI